MTASFRAHGTTFFNSVTCSVSAHFETSFFFGNPISFVSPVSSLQSRAHFTFFFFTLCILGPLENLLFLRELVPCLWHLPVHISLPPQTPQGDGNKYGLCTRSKSPAYTGQPRCGALGEIPKFSPKWELLGAVEVISSSGGTCQSSAG